MEGRAGEGGDERVGAGGERGDGGEGGWERVFFAGEEDGGDECPVGDVSCGQGEGTSEEGKDVRPVELGHCGEAVDYFVNLGPLQAEREILGSGVEIGRGMLENEVAIGLRCLVLALRPSPPI